MAGREIFAAAVAVAASWGTERASSTVIVVMQCVAIDARAFSMLELAIVHMCTECAHACWAWEQRVREHIH